MYNFLEFRGLVGLSVNNLRACAPRKEVYLEHCFLTQKTAHPAFVPLSKTLRLAFIQQRLSAMLRRLLSIHAWNAWGRPFPTLDWVHGVHKCGTQSKTILRVGFHRNKVTARCCWQLLRKQTIIPSFGLTLHSSNSYDMDLIAMDATLWAISRIRYCSANMHLFVPIFGMCHVPLLKAQVEGRLQHIPGDCTVLKVFFARQDTDQKWQPGSWSQQWLATANSDCQEDLWRKTRRPKSPVAHCTHKPTAVTTKLWE